MTAAITDASPTLIIAGSVRPKRICVAVAAWVATVGRDATGENLQVIDLKDWPLPLDDEPGIPAAGVYAHAHTQAWSRKIASASAFVLVTPQYNWGYPAALKNALDHLYTEWAGKPVMIVTYGGHGGDKCSAQLEQVCLALHMKPLPTKPQMRLARALIEANTGEIEPAAEFAAHLDELRQAFSELTAVRAQT